MTRSLISTPNSAFFHRLFSGSVLLILVALANLILFTTGFAENGKQNKATTSKTASLTQVMTNGKHAKNCHSLQSYLSGLDVTSDIIEKINHDLNIHINKTNSDSINDRKERKIVEFLHQTSYCFFQRLNPALNNQRLSWTELKTLLKETTPSLSLELSLIWLSYMRNHSSRLSKLYQIPFSTSINTQDLDQTYKKFQDILLTPGQVSMWQHCKSRFDSLGHDWKAELVAGFMSPAYQFVNFLKFHFDLKKSLLNYPAPGYGNFQSAIPDMLINLHSMTKDSAPSPWDLFYKNCAEFGIERAYPDHEKPKDTARFLGVEELYRDIFANPLLPKKIASDLPGALKASDFYPSPRGLKIILALSAQESTIQWNPKLNEQKKDLLRKRFDNILLKISQSIPESVSSFFLSDAHQKQLTELVKELHHLTNPKLDQTREYDFYLWSRRTYDFINELKNEYKQMAKVGQWFFDLQSLNSRLEKEPQTFGLWQINVNHLQEKIESFKQLQRAFPEIYQKTNGKWIVNRSWLIDALSGRPNARLNRKRTLELIIHTHLKPHYNNHMLGDVNDLMYFIAENMSGEMSTFRAAVQKELNKKMRSSLKTDGDLTYYLPYSTQIDWNRESQTYQKLKAFIGKHHYYFNKPVDADKLIRDLCQARSWEELRQLELYKKLRNEDSPIRIFPDIRSNLYNQTPLAYAKLVTRKSLLF